MTSDRFMIQFCKISNYFSDKEHAGGRSSCCSLPPCCCRKQKYFQICVKCLQVQQPCPRKCGVFYSSIFRSSSATFEGNSARVHQATLQFKITFGKNSDSNLYGFKLQVGKPRSANGGGPGQRSWKVFEQKFIQC